MTDDNNNAQAQAMIDALVPKIAEALLPQLQEATEQQVQGLKSKADELLGKLVDKKAENASLTAQLEQLSAQFDDLKATPPKQQSTPPAETRDIVISAEDRLNPRAYQRAKKLAEERGVDVIFEEPAARAEARERAAARRGDAA